MMVMNKNKKICNALFKIVNAANKRNKDAAVYAYVFVGDITINICPYYPDGYGPYDVYRYVLYIPVSAKIGSARKDLKKFLRNYSKMRGNGYVCDGYYSYLTFRDIADL